MLKVFLVMVVVELVATDRSVGVRKSVLVDIRRLRAPTSPLMTPEAPAPSFTRHKRESCCLASLVYPSLILPHPSLANFFTTIHQPPPTNQHHPSCYTMASTIDYSRVFPGAIQRRNGGQGAAGATKSPQYAASPSPARANFRVLCLPSGIQANNGIQTRRCRHYE